MMHNVETLKNRNVYIIDIYALLIHGYIYAECKEMSMYWCVSHSPVFEKQQYSLATMYHLFLF